MLLLVACVVHASAHRFLHSTEDAGSQLVADAQEQKLELGKFFDEVTSEASGLQKALNEEKGKNEELDKKATEAVGELKHAKAVFAEELHKVEAKVQAKVKALTSHNQKLEEELSRAKLSVVLHEKTEDALRARLDEIGKVFASQESAVRNIIATTSDVDNKLKRQDSKEKAEAKTEESEAKVEEKVEKVEDTKVDDAADTKVEDTKVDDVKVDDAADTKVDDVKVDDAKVDDTKVDDVKVDDVKVDDVKVDDTKVDDAADDKVEETKVEKKQTSVSLTHAAAKAKPKAEELDLDDKPKAAPVKASKEDSGMDSIKDEVDALDKEVDDTDAAPKSDSQNMLANAGDALTKLLKS